MRISPAVMAMLLAMPGGVLMSAAQQPASLSAQAPTVSSAPIAAKATIVLGHGAFADTSGWQTLIPLLQQDGYKVVAVQNSLMSLAGDVETTKLVFDERVLIVNRKSDVMVPASKSYALFQQLPDAMLILYPDSGHGTLFQYSDAFVREGLHFLRDRGTCLKHGSDMGTVIS
jgi:hypothetical protein